MTKTTITSISLPTDLFKQLEETKERTKMTRSRIIIEALQQYIGQNVLKDASYSDVNVCDSVIGIIKDTPEEICR